MFAVYIMADDEKASSSFVQKNDDNSESNPKLDVLSKEFDPLEALYSDNVKLPCPNARAFDNLDAFYRDFSGQTVRQNKPIKTDKKQGGSQRKWQEHQLPIQSTKHIRKAKNILTRMEEGEGVFSALRRYRDEQLRIKVVTRDDRGIRGYCIATLMAFDKHWNLLLKDVDEIWTRRKQCKIPIISDGEPRQSRSSLKPPKIEITKSGKKTQECRRFVYQMIMRGNDVVWISPLDDISEQANQDLELARQENEKKNAFRAKLNQLLIGHR